MIDIGHNPVVIDNPQRVGGNDILGAGSDNKVGHYISRMEEQAILRAAFWLENPTGSGNRM